MSMTLPVNESTLAKPMAFLCLGVLMGSQSGGIRYDVVEMGGLVP